MTKIEYADVSWNPVTGCTSINEGCQNCWAKRMAQRLRGRFGYPQDDPFAVTLHPDKLDAPLHWRKPRRIFVCSMGDLFHEDVPDAFRTDIFDVMTCADTMQHMFLVLTKRPENINKWENWVGEHWPGDTPWNITKEVLVAWPPNIWPGVTVCKGNELWKVEELLKIPAAKHWVSIEPCLEAMNIRDYLRGYGRFRTSAALDWVVLGGETGPGARPMHPEWARGIRDQCVSASVPFFFKGRGDWTWDWPGIEGWTQMEVMNIQGETRLPIESDEVHFFKVGKKRAGRLLDGREWNEFPE